MDRNGIEYGILLEFSPFYVIQTLEITYQSNFATFSTRFFFISSSFRHTDKLHSFEDCIWCARVHACESLIFLFHFSKLVCMFVLLFYDSLS